MDMVLVGLGVLVVVAVLVFLSRRVGRKEAIYVADSHQQSHKNDPYRHAQYGEYRRGGGGHSS